MPDDNVVQEMFRKAKKFFSDEQYRLAYDAFYEITQIETLENKKIKLSPNCDTLSSLYFNLSDIASGNMKAISHLEEFITIYHDDFDSLQTKYLKGFMEDLKYVMENVYNYKKDTDRFFETINWYNKIAGECERGDTKFPRL